jgi:hypothetical protein
MLEESCASFEVAGTESSAGSLESLFFIPELPAVSYTSCQTEAMQSPNHKEIKAARQKRYVLPA